MCLLGIDEGRCGRVDGMQRLRIRCGWVLAWASWVAWSGWVRRLSPLFFYLLSKCMKFKYLIFSQENVIYLLCFPLLRAKF
jgi:hypothetical protein